MILERGRIWRALGVAVVLGWMLMRTAGASGETCNNFDLAIGEAKKICGQAETETAESMKSGESKRHRQLAVQNAASYVEGCAEAAAAIPDGCHGGNDKKAGYQAQAARLKAQIEANTRVIADLEDPKAPNADLSRSADIDPNADRRERGAYRDHLGTGECAASDMVLAGGSKCKGTDGYIEAGKISNQVGQMAGSVATQAVGQTQAAKAMSEGTQSAALNASAETQITSGKIQVGAGAANVLMGAVQMTRAMKHGSNAKQLENANGAQVDALGAYVDGKYGEKFHTSDHKSLVSQAATEQRGKSAQAMAGAMASVMTGAQQAASGYFNIKAGEELKKAAAAYQNIEAAQLPSFGTDMMASDAMTERSAVAVDGSGTTTPETSAVSEETSDEGGDLGTPFNITPPNNDIAAIPTPGAFNEGGAGGGSGGGGGGLGGGGGTPASQAEREQQAQMVAKQDAPGSSYGSGSGYSRGAGGGKPDSGPDLSKMLEAFMKKDEDEKSKGSIEDYARSPASEPLSLLGRDVNIFERVHERYQIKQKAL